MKWDVYGTNVRRSNALRDYVKRRIIDRVTGFADGIRHLVVRARDVDLGNLRSPREVTATVTLAGGQTVRLSQEAHCFYAAVDQLSDRLRYVVRKRLDRKLFNARRRSRRAMRHRKRHAALT